MMSDGPGSGDPSVPNDEMRTKIKDLVEDVEAHKQMENNYNNYITMICLRLKDMLDAGGDLQVRAEIIEAALEENGVSKEDQAEFSRLWGHSFMITAENYEFANRVFGTLKRMFSELQAGVYGGRRFSDQNLGLMVVPE